MGDLSIKSLAMKSCSQKGGSLRHSEKLNKNPLFSRDDQRVLTGNAELDTGVSAEAFSCDSEMWWENLGSSRVWDKQSRWGITSVRMQAIFYNFFERTAKNDRKQREGNDMQERTVEANRGRPQWGQQPPYTGRPLHPLSLTTPQDASSFVTFSVQRCCSQCREEGRIVTASLPWWITDGNGNQQSYLLRSR